MPESDSPSTRELEVLRLLAKSPTKSLVPELLERSDSAIVSSKAGSEQKVILQLIELPLQLRDFLKSTKQLINTRGSKYGDGWYKEKSRFKIAARGPNPTIQEILAEVRRANPDRENVKLYGDSYLPRKPRAKSQLI